METFRCSHVSDDDKLGYAIDRLQITNTMPVVDDKGQVTGVETKTDILIGVLWDDVEAPAPSYHPTAELKHHYLPKTDLHEHQLRELEGEDAAEATEDSGEELEENNSL